MKRMTKDESFIGALLYPERSYWRPATRGDCANVQRPCPYVSCRHNMFLDVEPGNDSIRFSGPSMQPWKVLPGASCSLDLADHGGLPLAKVGAVLGVTRERVRQIEIVALKKVLKRIPPEDRDALRVLAASHRTSIWDDVG